MKNLQESQYVIKKGQNTDSYKTFTVSTQEIDGPADGLGNSNTTNSYLKENMKE